LFANSGVDARFADTTSAVTGLELGTFSTAAAPNVAGDGKLRRRMKL